MKLESILRPLQMAPRRKQGLMLADLHNHISKATPIKRILEISSHGVLGVTRHVIMRDTTYTYDGLFQRLSECAETDPRVEIAELEQGFAKVEYSSPQGDREGYILQTNESFAGRSHIVTIGGSTPPLRIDSDKIPDLKKSGSLVLLAHPFEINSRGFMTQFYTDRKLNKHPETQADILRVAETVDAIESFNAQWPIPYRHCNEMAVRLAEQLGLPQVQNTDNHPYQLAEFRTGIYISEPKGIREIKDAIKNNEFLKGPKSYVPMPRLVMSYLILLAQHHPVN